jgi:hypothetical protein
MNPERGYSRTAAFSSKAILLTADWDLLLCMGKQWLWRGTGWAMSHFTFGTALIVRVDGFANRAEALEPASLSE